MKLEFEVLELHTRHAFHISRMAAPPSRRSVWLRVRDEAGEEGWGEAAVSTPYYGESADTVAALVPRMEAALRAMGDDVLALERIERALDAAMEGSSAARAGVSAALHDLAGKRVGLPVWKLWGLDSSAAVSSFTIGIDELEVMREKVREAAGYPILKVKVGSERDAEILAMIREEAPDSTIRVDANTAWKLNEALAALPMLREAGVELIEQPLHPEDLDGMRALRARSSIPLMADESCIRLRDIPALAGAFDGINIKLAKCGGLREAIRMVHCARAHGMSVMLGCMVETTVGVASAVQLAPLCDYLDLDGAALLENDPFQGPGIQADGRIRFNSEPGLGVTLRDIA